MLYSLPHRLMGLLCSCALSACGDRGQDSAGNVPAADDSEQTTQVVVPQVTLRPGDVVAPLPEGSPRPSSDPRNLEGLWAGLGGLIYAEGKPPAYLPAVKQDLDRRREEEKRGTPVVAKGALCRPPSHVAVSGNQFPTQIIQRPDKILIVAEENRGVWPIYMNAQHPKDLQPSYTGHNVGHWEGNTLVIDSIGFNGKATSAMGGLGAVHSAELHVVTRITRANTADPLNGDRLVITRTVSDPQTYTQPWTATNVARWRPDMEMLEFNCEESPADVITDGLVVE